MTFHEQIAISVTGNSGEPSRRRATVAAARGLAIPTDQIPALVLAQGSLMVEYYAPRGTDGQQPHTRDELYVIISGSGGFVNGEDRHAFGPGDVISVAAGVPHRFEDFSDDFATWVIFYGPQGGEGTTAQA